ncbi:MAG: preprotein translocase subunit SecG [Paludibacteraceae bacterium]|nr:preprotein translocase subunit SecG [Paludibacteraceae bacterium]
MYNFLVILAVLISVVLVLLVLVQNSKGGGLASGFQQQNQYMGVRKTTDFLEKSTWTLVAVIVVICIAASGFYKHQHRVNVGSSELVEEATTQAQQQAPAAMSMEDAAQDAE